MTTSFIPVTLSQRYTKANFVFREYRDRGLLPAAGWHRAPEEVPLVDQPYKVDSTTKYWEDQDLYDMK